VAGEQNTIGCITRVISNADSQAWLSRSLCETVAVAGCCEKLAWFLQAFQD